VSRTFQSKSQSPKPSPRLPHPSRFSKGGTATPAVKSFLQKHTRIFLKPEARSLKPEILRYTDLYGRPAENFLPGNVRMPDERPRLREGGRHPRLAGIPPGSNRRRSRPGSLQHLLDSRQSRAESLSPPGRLQETR